MNCVDFSFSSVAVTGPFTTWCGDCYPLEDPDQDGLWTGTYTFDRGTLLEYKYLVDDWAGQEDLVDDALAGATCAPVTDYNAYANREVLLDGSITLDDSYGSCEECDIEPVAGDPLITFQVRMPNAYAGGVTLANSYDGWDSVGIRQLTDPDGDSVYTGAFRIPAGTRLEYKFVQGYNGSGTWETVPTDCGFTTGAYTNRLYEVGSQNEVLSIVSFGACDEVLPNPDDTLCGSSPGRVSPVEIVGREMRINGQPIFLKGVTWAPTPVGNGPGNYYAQAVETDAVLMAAAGINAVRTYGEITDREVLDILWDNGIYVMMTVYYGYSETAASTAAKVCALKDHPAIIGWVVGNEWNYTNLAQDISFDDAVTKVGVIIDAIKENDDSRPASTIYGGMPPGWVFNALSNVDLWGTNHYPGVSFYDFFSQWAAIHDGPLYFGEYGADVYDSRINAPNEAMQANIVEDLTQEIYDNASNLGLGVSIGGFVFEFNDEWWKYQGGGWGVHDTAPSWSNGGYPDPEIQEEWWGIVDINRNPREAYYRLRDLGMPE